MQVGVRRKFDRGIIGLQREATCGTVSVELDIQFVDLRDTEQEKAFRRKMVEFLLELTARNLEEPVRVGWLATRAGMVRKEQGPSAMSTRPSS